MSAAFQTPNQIRTNFSAAMSAMYKTEVPAYGQIMDIVGSINEKVLAFDRSYDLNLLPNEDTNRISQERHGEIRVGTAAELSMPRLKGFRYPR